MLEGLSVKEAAARSGLSREYIRKLLQHGKIQGRKVIREWIISRESLDRFVASERKMGRPPIDK